MFRQVLLSAVAMLAAMSLASRGSALADPPANGELIGDLRPRCELRLEVLPPGTEPKVAVYIKNVGRKQVTLVMPGDGSECGWRTPVTGWSLLPADSKDHHPAQPTQQMGGARCGNVSCLRPQEVFELQPGESKKLDWIYLSNFLPPGKYRAVVYYSNVPSLKWSGIPLGQHDAAAMKRVTESTPMSLVSNEVLLEFAAPQNPQDAPTFGPRFEPSRPTRPYEAPEKRKPLSLEGTKKAAE